LKTASSRQLRTGSARAVESMIATEERIAAAALQRSLLPAALPASRGVQMAARYVPGEGAVGGDWYDVFTLPSGQLGVVMGDVTGSGLPAAVIMGRMRSALRAYALETADPADVLARLDAKMQHFEPGALATVAYAVFEPGLEQARVCLAGHYPPVLAAEGESARLASVAPGLLIGAAPGAHRPVTTLRIAPGTLVCFYTDGLIERHGQTIDDGLDQLCREITAQLPDAVCAAVMAALVGSTPARDDIALLMIRRSPSGETP
jgi:phosphoserine phosphatase RsbU/P